jgi:aspartate aminotransferase-like enzyme
VREALSIACGEGLEALWARHQQVPLRPLDLPWQQAAEKDCLPRGGVLEPCCCGLSRLIHLQMYRLLWGGLVSLGLQPFVEAEEDRLATVNTIKVNT